MPEESKTDVDIEHHRQRHKALHQALDELVADYMAHTHRELGDDTIADLLAWSASQVEEPDPHPRHDPGKPRYKHPCECCSFLGYFQLADLYFCRQEAMGGRPTVIARYSDTPSDYDSGLVFANQHPALASAKRRALAARLLREDQVA